MQEPRAEGIVGQSISFASSKAPATMFSFSCGTAGTDSSASSASVGKYLCEVFSAASFASSDSCERRQ